MITTHWEKIGITIALAIFALASYSAGSVVESYSHTTPAIRPLNFDPLPQSGAVYGVPAAPVPESIVNTTVITASPRKALRSIAALAPEDGKEYDVFVTVTPRKDVEQ